MSKKTPTKDHGKPKGSETLVSPIIGSDRLDFAQDKLEMGRDRLDFGRGGLMDEAQPDADGPPEATPDEQLSELHRGFRDRAKAENQRFVAATDSEYWFAVCFQSRAQKEAFLKALGWLAHGDKYLDGTSLADALSICLPSASVPFVPEKPDRLLSELAMELPEVQS